MTVLTSSSLGDLVTADPRRARVLESYGLDYCCGGQQSLADAAAAAGLDAAGVAAALDLPGEAEPMAARTSDLASLAHDIIDTHHAYLWEEMPRLQALVAKVHGVHGQGHPELTEVRSNYERLIAELEDHLTREERAVFPAISRLERTQAPVDVRGVALADAMQELIDEHDVAGELLAEINRLTDGFAVPEDGCASYRMMLAGLQEMQDDLHLHVHKENNILFPQVLELDRSLRAG